MTYPHLKQQNNNLFFLIFVLKKKSDSIFMKTLAPSDVSTAELQRIMQTAIAPRPIAFASTIDKAGKINLSPFSFFNMFSTKPPILIFSPARRVRDNTTKHTLENVLEIPEVVIGTVNYKIIQQASLASTEYDKETNEFLKAGFNMKDAEVVQPKLIEECPVNFECKVLEVKHLGTEGGAGNLIICEVVKIHLRTEYLDENGHLDQNKLDMVARLGGDCYSRNSGESLFYVPKPLTTKGIGFDLLPDAIKYSKVFTGNDLGMLANTERLPGAHFSDDETLHLKAQEYLQKHRVQEAWEILVKK